MPGIELGRHKTNPGPLKSILRDGTTVNHCSFNIAAVSTSTSSTDARGSEHARRRRDETDSRVRIEHDAGDGTTGGAAGGTGTVLSSDSGVAEPETRDSSAGGAADSDMQGQEQASTVRARQAPAEPTQKERDDHEASGHAVYRNWCRACVAARGRSDAHPTTGRSETATARLSMDYCTLSSKDGEEDALGATTILATQHSVTGKLTGHCLPCKGAEDQYPVDVLCRILEVNGSTKLEVMSDNEPAILALKRRGMEQARVRHGLDLIPLEAIEYEHQTNGAAEVAVREVKASVRAATVLVIWSRCESAYLSALDRPNDPETQRPNLLSDL